MKPKKTRWFGFFKKTQNFANPDTNRDEMKHQNKKPLQEIKDYKFIICV